MKLSLLHEAIIAEVIRPVGGGKYKVFSKKGKPLSRALSKKAAHRRLGQIEFFKHRG